MKSSKKLVFRAWILEEETKGLESISELLPSLSFNKKPVSSTLIPLPVIDKALVDEETQVGTLKNLIGI